MANPFRQFLDLGLSLRMMQKAAPKIDIELHIFRRVTDQKSGSLSSVKNAVSVFACTLLRGPVPRITDRRQTRSLQSREPRGFSSCAGRQTGTLANPDPCLCRAGFLPMELAPSQCDTSKPLR
jgi:hypothetical protein